ncbi:MAG TPA: methyltransferase domain-containing protein [Nocardioides sp.]|jgi:hypothetical protein|nr:methyltransferase domain-containing protein [Nocardioides sp.]
MALAQQAADVLRRVARRLDPPVRPQSRPVSAADLASLPDAPPSASGSRPASMFFDTHPRFYDTSETASGRARLNLRYEAIFAENLDILDGATVLDIASHDGRWSLAALACGARSVVGIEARSDLVDHAVSNLAQYGYDADRCRFIVGDVHDVLRSQELEMDVVLCLGFLYHTLRYNELFRGIRATGARHVIIDTEAPRMMSDRASIQVFSEPSDKQSAAAADELTHGSSVLTGRPNLSAIRTMLDSYGYRVERLSDWAALLRDNPDLVCCGDYERQYRLTLRCVDSDAVPAR